MPEIKNNFSQGKMNQDLDERIVPTGVYRNAMNIQVSTSDDADVGTARNIRGNISIENVIGGDLFNCVGSIADEKNNKLYWFIHSINIDAILEYDTSPNTPSGVVNAVIIDKNFDTLKFDGNLITGINIIDDILLWTDNANEPKKINITRCKQGNSALINIATANHTKLVVNNTVTNVDLKEEHITVIKKRPSTAPVVHTIKPSGQEILTGLGEFSQGNAGVYLSQPGDTAYIRMPRTIQGLHAFRADGYQWQPGHNLILSQTSSGGALPSNQEARCKVISVIDTVGGPGFTTWEVEILSIDNNVPTTITTFDGPYPPSTGVNLGTGSEVNVMKEVDLEKRLFGDKFVRFGTRWKYEDGEYSAFSPFSDVAFNASSFSFHPTKNTYNLGMENNCERIDLKHLIPPNIPEDVVQVDILLKNENSPVVYSLDSTKPNDPVKPGETHNNWNQDYQPMDAFFDSNTMGIEFANLPTKYKGRYSTDTENIHAALPSNQLLRPWDNVPKTALAQDVTGNRIVYANYTQGYNMLQGGSIAKDLCWMEI